MDGVDYVHQNYVLKFEFDDCNKTKSLSLQPVDDNIVEANETYNLNISSITPKSLQDHVTLGQISTVTIVIPDDDGK